MNTQNTPDLIQEDHLEGFMFASQCTNFFASIYHYKKINGDIMSIPMVTWITKGIPSEYLSPPGEIDVMNHMDDFHEFRQKMITHMYQEYVVDWNRDEDVD